MPKSPLWNNYALAWQRGISKYFLNSVLVTGSTIVGAILVSALASYSLARFRFKGNQLIFILCMGGMMLSPQVTLIPLYKIIQALHIHNTYLALIIPYTAYRIPLICHADFVRTSCRSPRRSRNRRFWTAAPASRSFTTSSCR